MREAIFIIVIIVLLYLVFNTENIEQVLTKDKVCNRTDNRCYPVVNKYNENNKASEILAELNLFAIKLLRHLRDKYIWNYSNNTSARDITIFLLSNYNPDGIIENDPSSDVNTSYVDDKGRVLALCLREKTSGNHKFHSMHVLQFVLIHEMSHMATIAIGHEEDFWTNFKFLLKEAELAGIYTSVNYDKNPINYCSLEVTYNPYFDDELNDIHLMS